MNNQIDLSQIPYEELRKEVKRRNDEGEELKFDPSLLNTTTSGSTDTTTSGGGTLPNFDNRDDWTNIKEIKGVTLVCMPPFHFSTLKTKDED